MLKHQKPTQEELEQGIKDNLAKADKLRKPTPSPPAPTTSPSAPAPTTSPSGPVSTLSVSPSITPSASMTPSVSPSAPAPTTSPSEPAPSPSPNYKRKFSASSRENQKINAKNRKINQAIDSVKDMPDPTDEEMKAEYDDWDDLSEFEKKMAMESEKNKRFRENISKAREEGKKIEKWSEDVDKFLDDPQSLIKNPELEGKQEDFRAFANEEKNHSVPMKTLVGSFLYEQSKNKKPKKKGQMFPTGSGGSGRGKKNTGKVSFERGQYLKKYKHKEYKRLLKAHKIEAPKL